jgi:hypothetical protein
MSLVLHCQLGLILHDYAIHKRHGIDLWVSIVAAIGSLRDKAAWDYGVDDMGKGTDTSRQHQAPNHTTRRQIDKLNTNTAKRSESCILVFWYYGIMVLWYYGMVVSILVENRRN